MFHCFVKVETDLFMINIFNLRNSAIATIFPHFCRMVHYILLKLLLVGFKTRSPSVTTKHGTHCNIHCVPFKVSIMCPHQFSTR